MPKTDNYLKYDSPVAKEAKKNGFKIRLEERLITQRTIIFEKVKQNE